MRSDVVPRDALACGVHYSEEELGIGISLLRGLAVPPRRFGVVLGMNKDVTEQARIYAEITLSVEQANHWKAQRAFWFGSLVFAGLTITVTGIALIITLLKT